jgi:hypothetical protein
MHTIIGISLVYFTFSEIKAHLLLAFGLALGLQLGLGLWLESK